MSMNCFSVHNLGYSAFSGKLHDQASQMHIPINGSVEVTMRCNLRCLHCYVPLTQRAARAAETELKTSEFARIFSELADAGCLWLLLTGGEPLLRPDFLDLYDLAKREGFILSLFTNGTLLNDRIADHLAEWRPFSVEISIYGATQSTHEKVTGIPGSYARCMRGIELLLSRNLPIKLKSVLLSLNQNEMSAMQRFAENLGLEFRYDPVITSCLDGNPFPTQFRLSPEEIVAMESQDEIRAKAWPAEYEYSKNSVINVPNMYTCGAGRCSFHMDAFGKLSLCLAAREPSYDLRVGTFRQGWEEFIPQVLSRVYREDFECLTCDLRMVCAQCPAMGITELGDPQSKVPFLCALAHQRHEVFDTTATEMLK